MINYNLDNRYLIQYYKEKKNTIEIGYDFKNIMGYDLLNDVN